MPSGPKKRRAAKKKNQNDASSTNSPEEKLVTNVELPETISIESEMSVCEVNAEVVSEMPSTQNQGKELGSVDGVSTISVIDMTVSEMGSKEIKGKESESVDDQKSLVELNLKKGQEKEQVMEPVSEFVDNEIISEESLVELSLKKGQENEQVMEPVSEVVDDEIISEESFAESNCKKIQENEQVMEPVGQVTVKAVSEFVDDQNVVEESLVEPTLQEMKGNKPAKETVEQLTEDLSVGLEISKEAVQDSFEKSLQSGFVEPPAIVYPVFDKNSASEVAGRVEALLDELVCYSENQLKVYKEMNLKTSQLLEEIRSGKPK